MNSSEKDIAYMIKQRKSKGFQRFTKRKQKLYEKALKKEQNQWKKIQDI